MLMAAGLGTRLRPYTGLVPKPLLPVMGVPMAQFSVDTLIGAGVTRIVANVHHLADQAEAGLKALKIGTTSLMISDERSELLGSAGGLRQAQRFFGGGPFFLLNADILCDVDLRALAQRHAELRDELGVVMTLTVFPKGPRGAAYREIIMDERGSRMKALGEPAEGRPFFVGAAIIEPEALLKVPPTGPAEFIPSILMPAVEAGRVGIFKAKGEWLDIGSPPLWHRAHIKLLKALEKETIAPSWRSRIEATNQRLASMIWVPRTRAEQISVSAWQGPVYWGTGGDVRAKPPKILGPRAMLYGDLPESAPPSHGIGFQGIWTTVPKPPPRDEPKP